MIKIRDIKLGNGMTSDELANLVYDRIGLDVEKVRVELMECRASERYQSYIDLFYRIDKTSDLLLICNIGIDSSLVRVAFKQRFYESKGGYYDRCHRLAKRFSQYGLTYEFVYAFSDSEGVLTSFIRRLRNKRLKEQIREKLASSETNIESKREIIRKIIGDNLAKRARLATKQTTYVEVVAKFLAEHY